MGRISSLLLVAALLELLEALVAGGRLSLPEGPKIRQSQDTQARDTANGWQFFETVRGSLCQQLYSYVLRNEAGSFIRAR